MKKSLIALAVLGGFTGMAAAQSSVTLFGVVDVAGRYVDDDGGGKRYTLSPDGLNSSRFGVRGVEDLGGGLRAGFWLESGFSPDTGTTQARFWHRRSTVSLLGGFGEVRMGRDYTPIFWNNTIFDPFGTNGVGSSTNVALFAVGAPNAPATLTFTRSDNSIGYFLPSNIGGIYGQAMVAAGEGGPGRHIGGRIGWAGGPFNVAAAYGEQEVTPGGAIEGKAFNVGGSWNFGFATLMGYYAQEEVEGAAIGDIEDKRFTVGAIMPLGQGEIKIAYSLSERDIGTTSPEAQQLAIGYVYNLSKRTAIYATGSVIDNDGGAAVAIPGGPGVSANGKSMGIEGGLRHSF
jgi:predicted porin